MSNLACLMFACLFSLTTLECTALGQNVSVAGIQLGMTLSEAEAKLPPGFVVLDPKRVPKGIGINAQLALPSQFQIAYAVKGTDALFSRTGTDEGYTIETVNGRVAYVCRRIYLPVGNEVDYETYRKQLFSKYGPESKEILRQYVNSDPRGPKPERLHWSWDANGNQDPGFREYPGRVDHAPGALFQSHQEEFGSGIYTTQFPKNPNVPGAFVSLIIQLERTDSRVALGAVDRITFELSNMQPFIADAAQGLAAEQKKQRDAADSVRKRTGPPPM